MKGKFGGGKVWRIDLFRAFGERKFGELIDQPIDYKYCTNLDDFSLVNHRRFAKFANVSPRQSFPPYSMIIGGPVTSQLYVIVK